MSLRGNRKSKSIVTSEVLFRRGLGAETCWGGVFGSHICMHSTLGKREYFDGPFQNMRNAVRDREASPGRWKGENCETKSQRILRK